MQAMHVRARELIESLHLTPHSEGGYFREVHRSTRLVKPADGRPTRSSLTIIYFLLVADQISRWHRVASDESWQFIEGDTLELHIADPELERVHTSLLGLCAPTIESVRVVHSGCWQAARTRGDYTLVSCAVGPGFEYDDFVLLRDLPDQAEALKSGHPPFGAFL